MKSPRLKNDWRDSDVRLKPGDVTWVKLRGSSWWPAQVVDENSVSETCRPRKKVKSAVLLRLYGSYEYVYRVEPMKNLQSFKNILEQQNCSWQDMVQKAIGQAMLKSSSGKSENNSKSADTRKHLIPKETNKEVERASLPSKNSNKRSKSKQDEIQKKAKGDVPAVTPSLTKMEKSPELSARRLKVMQNLGLVAPSGSPFYKNGNFRPLCG